MKKRSMSLLLVLVMVFSLLPTFSLNAAATNSPFYLVDNKIKITWSTNASWGDNYVNKGDDGKSISAQQSRQNTYMTITLTNNSTESQNITFGYNGSAMNGKGTVVIPDVGTFNSGSFSGNYPAGGTTKTLAPNESIQFSLTRANSSAGSGEYTTLNLTNITLTPVGGTDPTPPPSPDIPIGEDDIVDGNYVFSPAQEGLKVGDDIDLSQTYYVDLGTNGSHDWREVTITKDTYYTKVANDGDTHNDRVQKVQKTDGYYGEASPVSGWTPITGEGMYYMKDAESAAVHNNFVLVQSETGTLTHDAYTNKLIAAKSGNTTDGMIVGPSESIGGWNTGTSDVIVVDAAGNEHTVLYANKGSTFHYNMFIYYVDTNGDVVFLTQGANESDGDSKYYNTYPSDPKSDTPEQGVGKYYYTYNNTLGSYGGKGYYTGTYYRARNHEGKVALFIMDGTTKRYLGRDGIDHQTTAIHDHMVVYTGPLYRLQTLQRATYFSYTGLATPVESRLDRDVLTNLTLYTRRMSGESEITDTDPDNGTGADQMGVLVDTTNNFKGNLFIQKKLYRKDDGTYNIKLESWATGNMSTTGGEAMDVILVVDLSHSMKKDDETNKPWTINGEHRIVPVRNAITQFINTMYDANQAGGDIRLAITSFSNKQENTGTDNKYPLGVYNGSTFTAMKNANSSHYKAALKQVDGTGKTQLLASLQTTPFQDPEGNGTYPEYGMQQAIKILQNRDTADQNRKAVIVFFTDGWTGTDDISASKYAENALLEANTLKKAKAQGGYDATIYSIGVFHFDDSNTYMKYEYTGDKNTFTVQNYMQHMSSMYNQTTLTQIDGYGKTAKEPSNMTPDNTDQTYYYRIQTGTGDPLADLNNAFNNIATTIADTDVPVDSNSILRDVINENDFALPKYVASGDNATVKVSEVPAAAINSRKQIQWNYDGETTAAGVTASPIQDGAYLKGVNVSGYNYQSHFSAPNLADLSKSDLGDKLVVRIYGLMPKHGGEVYSNSDAGILSETENSTPTNRQYEMYLPVESPFDDIATRPYVVDFNASMKVAENAYLVSNANNSRKYVTNIMDNKSAAGQNNGSFAKDNNSTVTYQFLKKGIANGEQAAYDDYTFTDTDTALVFGEYYANGTRAESGKTTGNITTKQRVEGEKVDQTVAKAWQVVNMIPASSVYFDDGLSGTTVNIGDGSGYNAGVTATPGGEKSGWTFAFTGTGIDIYCTTNDTSGIAQAKLDGDNTTVQSMRNYSITERYNVPTFSFRGLDYGQHSVTIKTLTSSHYKFDGIRVYGPVEDQSVYADTTEQYAAYINMREVLVNNNATTAFSDSMTDVVLGALFVDDSSKLVRPRVPTDAEIEAGTGIFYVDAEGNQVEEGTEGAKPMINAYANEFEAYKKNSPKHEIYLDNNEAITFVLSADAETAAANGNLWIGLSAPDAPENAEDTDANTGTVTLKEGKTIDVTSGVDMYYPITSDMIGANRVVTLTNTGDNMISVTNLKITGNETIYTAANAPASSEGEGGTGLAVKDAVPLVFAPLTMQTVKIAANNGVDPDAVVEPGNPDDPDTPDTPDTPDKPGWNDDTVFNPLNLLRNLFQNILKSLSDLFRGLGNW